jgi:acyl carrier protein
MTQLTAQDVRAFVVETLDEQLRAAGADPAAIPDDFDLHRENVIDSLGILELITALEERFGVEIDYEELDPEELTIVGPFSRYVAERSRQAA